jgi:MFS family permease
VVPLDRWAALFATFQVRTLTSTYLQRVFTHCFDLRSWVNLPVEKCETVFASWSLAPVLRQPDADLRQLLSSQSSDRFGRRICLYTVILFTLAGVVIEVVANDWKQWLGSKVYPYSHNPQSRHTSADRLIQIVVGFATGIMQSAVPTYVSEVSPREIRGIMLSFFNMASTYSLLSHPLSG